jgi:hypothetical protein
LIAFSQRDTSHICFDYNVGKLIAIDLVKGDSAIAELNETKILLDLYKKQSIEKDTMIEIYKSKETNYLTYISNTEKVVDNYKKINLDLTKSNTNLQDKNKRLKTTVKILGGSTAALLILVTTQILIKP